MSGSWSLDGGLAFRDRVTSAAKTKHVTRVALDEQRLLCLRREGSGAGPRKRMNQAGQVKSLRDACITVLGQELLFGHLAGERSSTDAGVCDPLLDQEENALFILWDDESSRPRLLDPLALLLLETVFDWLPQHERVLPIGVWLAFVRVYFPSDLVFRPLPMCKDTDENYSRQRNLSVYLGLVLSDTMELDRLAALGRPSPFRHALLDRQGFPQFSTLTIVDLSYTTWSDDDMQSLRLSVGATLAWLALSGTKVSDFGIAHLARGLHYEMEDTDECDNTVSDGPRERFCRLQGIVLKSLRGVSDRGLSKLARLPSLRLIDARDTSCTTASKWLLNSCLSKSNVGTKAVNQFSSAADDEICSLFSERSHPSARMEALRSFCGMSDGSNAVKFFNDKSLFVFIEDGCRAPESGVTRFPVVDPWMPPEKHRARSAAHGSIYATVRVSQSAILEDSAKDGAARAAFSVSSHAQTRSWCDPDRSAHYLWARNERLRRQNRARLGDGAHKDGTIAAPLPDPCMLLRREPIPVRPELLPSSRGASSTEDHLAATAPLGENHSSRNAFKNPAKRKDLADAPRDQQLLKVRRIEAVTLEAEVFGQRKKVVRVSSLDTRCQSATPGRSGSLQAREGGQKEPMSSTSTPGRGSATRGRLGAALRKDVNSTSVRSMHPFFRRAS